MGIPKKKSPIKERKSRLDIEKAMKSAALMETPGVSPEEGSAKNSSHESPDVDRELEKITTEKPKEIQQSPPPKSAAIPKKTKEKVTGKVGRPPLIEGRTERITVWFRPEVKKRLKRALLQDKLLRDEKDQDIDQSLLVEEALESWFKTHKY